MTAPDAGARHRIEAGLANAEAGGVLSSDDGARSSGRLAALHAWLGGFAQPDLSVVGSAAHLELADELAAGSITLVRDDNGMLPLRLAPGARILAIQSRPTDQTPADTTSTVAPGLAAALRERFAAVDEIIVEHAPSADEIAAVREAAGASDAVVVGTSAAFFEPAQAALVDAVLSAGRPTVTVALRTPFDLAAYPAARCHVAAYGILPPTLSALAAALAGAARFPGRLPAAVPGLYPAGHGLVAGPAAAAR
jgi:beta-N-acetylhexosaminidase